MSRRAARVKLCPTPSKARHATEDEAADAGVEREEQAALIVGSPQLELYVYGREGEPCKVCGTRLVMTHDIDARGTVLCWRCQT